MVVSCWLEEKDERAALVRAIESGAQCIAGWR